MSRGLIGTCGIDSDLGVAVSTLLHYTRTCLFITDVDMTRRITKKVKENHHQLTYHMQYAS